MKIFNCGKCKAPYKLDENQFNGSEIIITCLKCGAKNCIKFGPFLLFSEKDGKQTRYFLKKGENAIGRNSGENDPLNITDQHVSRKHAIVYAEQLDGKWFFSIEDQKSTNGTYNQQKIRLKPHVKYPFPPDAFYILGLTKVALKIN